MAAGNTQLYAAQGSTFVVDGIQRTTTLYGHIRGGVIGILPTVGNGVGILRANIISTCIILAVNELTASLTAETMEHALNMVQVTIEIQVFSLNIQNDAVFRNIINQSTVTFITLCYKVLAILCPVSISTQYRDFSTHIVARTHAPLS